MSAVRLDAPPGLTSDSLVFLFFELANISRSILARQSSVCGPNSNEAWASCRASVLVQNVLAQVQSFYSSVTGQLILGLDRWSLRHTLGCRTPRAANTQIQELQVPSAIALKTSHTTRLDRSCWRQQEKFIGAIKLADKDSSHPSHIREGQCVASWD